MKRNTSRWAFESGTNQPSLQTVTPAHNDSVAFVLCPAIFLAGKSSEERRDFQELYRVALEKAQATVASRYQDLQAPRRQEPLDDFDSDDFYNNL